MTTPTLTREQADFLRVIASGRIVKICNQGHVEGEDQPSDEFIESLDGLIECVWDCVDHGESPDLTEAGREALAAYDVGFVTVRRDDVRDATGSFEKSIVLAERDGPTWEEPREALARLRAALEAT